MVSKPKPKPARTDQRNREDMQTHDLTKEDVDRLLSKGNTEFEEEIPSAQVPRQNTSSEHKSKQPKERLSTSSHQQNGPGRKRPQDQDKPAKTGTDVKGPRQGQEKSGKGSRRSAGEISP